VETPDSICEFWFGTSSDDAATAQQGAKMWWSKNPEVDLQICERFSRDVAAVGMRERDAWSATPKGVLALILLTDQFARNIHRGAPQAFECDALAREWARSAIGRGIDRKLRPIERVFLYLPFEHSESIEDQAMSVKLFTQLYQDVPAEQMDIFRGYLIFALRHRRIIERFGRFPHRNQILGRPSTPEEAAFLQEPGSSF
jgi:uncharacterized protein (DUF924 family)